jgi:hypothetical protein
MLAAALAASIACAAISLAQAETSDGNLSAAERWAWSQIADGFPADFNVPCGQLDPQKEDDPGWADPRGCRSLSGGFVVNLFTKASFHDRITNKGVTIIGAKVVGDVNLAFVRLDRPVQTLNSRFEGAMSLGYAHAESLVDLSGSLFTGGLDATAFHSESDLDLKRTSTRAPISNWGLILNHATVAGFVDLSGATCSGDLLAEALQVGDSLFMDSRGEDKATFKNVVLRHAKITATYAWMG